MRLSELIAGTGVRVDGADGDVDVRGITDDSRRVEPGFVFIARRGTAADGSAFVPDAVARGAVAVLAEGGPAPHGVARLTADGSLVSAAALLAERFHGNPTRRLTLIGITGTNGKTTTAHLVHQMLGEPGRPCGLIGTVRIDDGVRAVDASLTTPPATELSAVFGRMVSAGCGAAVMEVSSHALHQGRVAALAFDVGVFTNLTGDHLDYHGSMDEYAAAKAILFRMLPPDGVAVVNAEDEAAGRMLTGCSAGVMWCWVNHGAGEPPPRLSSGECRATIRSMTMNGTAAEFTGPWGVFEARIRLVGRHNVMNALQAVAACHAAGLASDRLRERLEAAAAPPGRLEPVTAPADPFAVLVDYAHSDDALRKVLTTLRPLVPPGGRLRVVFGCGGDRDRTKRPRMGAAAAALADDVYVTSDNPRTESARDIIEQIVAGMEGSRAGVIVEENRARAIRRAIGDATAGDLVLIAGKGHETYQIVPDGRGGTVRLDFDDRVEARRALDRREPEPSPSVIVERAQPVGGRVS